MLRHRITTCGLILAIAVASRARESRAALDDTAPSKTYYSIEIGGKRVGYAKVQRDQVSIDGRRRIRVVSDFSIKVALLGSTRNMSRHSETLFDAESARPLRFELSARSNDAESHILCKFDRNSLQIWKYTDPQHQGTPQTVALAGPTAILGSNNFGHWSMILEQTVAKSGDRSSELQVFLPDAGQVSSFVIIRGDTKEIETGAGRRQAQLWQITGDMTEFYADPKTGRLLEMQLPSQKTRITLADATVEQETPGGAPQEILATHFAQSNVRFDDFQKVRQLTARIDVQVIGSGISNPSSTLTTAMQSFDGTKVADSIKGVVTISSSRFEGKASPAFPSAAGTSPDLIRWTQPEPLIESDDPAIVELGRQITAGAADRWQAVKRVTDWVHEKIAYKIADTPSARRALETRMGDCGPHATLAAALLRSVGIPARLVGGLLYTPMLGGTFGQHAWIEVHLGKDGWIALDPTTGEMDQLSAVHIKLFEGMGGVIPASVEVTAFDPPNANRQKSSARRRPLPWKTDHEYSYTYLQNDKEIGRQRFTISEVEQDGDSAWKLVSNAALKTAPTSQTQLRTRTELVASENGRPLSFHRSFDVAGTKTTIDCTFGDERVDTKIRGKANLDREMAIPADAFCFDNNLIPSFAVICSQLDLKQGGSVAIDTYHPSTMQVIGLTFHVQRLADLKWGDKTEACYVCDVAPLKNTFWITRDGRLLKVTAATLEINLQPVK